MTDPRYPIGPFTKPERIDATQRSVCIEQIAQAPLRLRDAVDGLSQAQLDTSYRDGGWTVRQVVHHVADSHLNAYARLRLALTEDNPTIRPYDEGAWAKLSDAAAGPVEWSLELLAAVHRRWVACLRSLPTSAFARPYLHPEGGPFTVDGLLAMYSWHGRHHTAHVTGLRTARGW